MNRIRETHLKRLRHLHEQGLFLWRCADDDLLVAGKLAPSQLAPVNVSLCPCFGFGGASLSRYF